MSPHNAVALTNPIYRSAFLDSDVLAHSLLHRLRRCAQTSPKSAPDGAKNGVFGADFAKRIPQGLKPAWMLLH
jgi:hypothetical protein